MTEKFNPFKGAKRRPYLDRSTKDLPCNGLIIDAVSGFQLPNGTEFTIDRKRAKKLGLIKGRR